MKTIELGLLKTSPGGGSSGAGRSQGPASHPGLGQGLAAPTQLSQTCPTFSRNSQEVFQFWAETAWYH